MKKSDLKTGMRVHMTNGVIGIVMLDIPAGDAIINTNRTYSYVRGYRDDLTYNLREYQIDKVYAQPCLTAHILDPVKHGALLWEREIEEMITVKGKEYSESTLFNALKDYIGD